MAWRQWLKLYAGFTIFWTIFELTFMFLLIVCLIDNVVLRSSSINGDDTAGAGGKWIRLKRLHSLHRWDDILLLNVHFAPNSPSWLLHFVWRQKSYECILVYTHIFPDRALCVQLHLLA
jgi:hypothetical protein